jgi:signal peptidase I
MNNLTRRTALLTASAACLFAPSAFADIPRVFRLPSNSMEPTILAGEYFMAMPILNFSEITRGDIVVFRQGNDNRTMVKRVMAFGGDRISFSGGRPTVNGTEARWTPQAARGPLEVFNETVNDHSYQVELGGGTSEVRDVPESAVPDGHVYVVGDSRDRSFDSRVPVFGRVLLREISHRATSILRSDDPSRVGRALE